MKVSLVTGCAGFIGSHMVDFLLKKKHLVYGIDNLSSGKIINNLKKFCKNLTIIFISHNYKHLTLCENVYKLRGKKLKKIK